MRGVLLVICAMIEVSVLHAQTIQGCDVVRREIDTLFSKIEKDRVPTGLLLDNAIEFVDIRKYNGQKLTDATLVNGLLFKDILKTLNSCSITTPRIANIDQYVPNTINATSPDNNVNIIAALFRYNYIQSNAITDALISFDGKYVRDIYKDDVWQNPYGEDCVFAMTTNYKIFKQQAVCLNLAIPQTLRNTNPKKVYCDPDDGSGYRLVNDIESGRIWVIYRSDGEKRIKMKVELQNGRVLETHASIYIDSTPVPSSLNDVPQLPYFEIYEDGGIAAHVYYKTYSGDNMIRRPFIIVEGFDPWQLLTIKEFGLKQRHENLNLYNGFTTYADILDSFLLSDLAEYDFVYVDWYDSTKDLFVNASALISVINEINSRKAEAGSTERNIIMGQSMGGLITRLALCMMEMGNCEHEVSTYISHDVPHLGANVPLGAQYFIMQLLSYMGNYSKMMTIIDFFNDNKLSDAQKAILDIAYSDSVSQMLINYLNKDATIDHQQYQSLQASLAEFGFPKGDNDFGIETLAIVNGGEYNINQHLTETGKMLMVKGEASDTMLASVISFSVGCFLPFIPIALALLDMEVLSEYMLHPGTSSIIVDAEINPYLSHNSASTISMINVDFIKTFPWQSDLQIVENIFNSAIPMPNQGIPCDDYNGSTYSTRIDEVFEYDDAYFLNASVSADVIDKIMFIPISSALAIGNSVVNMNSCDKELLNKTPFDSYYFTDINNSYADSHISIDYKTFDWVYDQINSCIIGPDVVVDKAVYAIDGVNMNVSWDVSDTSVATIDKQTGCLQALKNGVVTIRAVANLENGSVYSKKKKVYIKFPDYIITKRYVINKGYVFSVHFLDSNNAQKLEALVEDGAIKCRWSILNGNDELIVYDNSNGSICYSPNKNEVVSISLQLVCSDDIKSMIKTVTMNLQVPFEINYKYVVVSKTGDVYYVKNDDTYEVGSPSESLAIKFQNVVLDPSDNILSLVSKYIGGVNCYISYEGHVESYDELDLGIKSRNEYKWFFPFFDSEEFVETVTAARSMAGGDEPIIVGNIDVSIYNSRYEIIMDVPFVVLYNPRFPANWEF